MTSNIGSSFLIDESMKTGNISDETREKVMYSLKNHFRPEFLNRVDEVLLFKPLMLQEIKGIVGKLMEQLQTRLSQQLISISISEEAKSFIAENGFDPIYGARPLKRYIQREVETMLAKKIIAGEIGSHSAATIVLVNGSLELQLT
jgi:ATP-dependent Clp protease ATP-binding subunit ClpB